MSGIEEAAGGVDSANKRRRTKKATKIFIPESRCNAISAHDLLIIQLK